LDRIRPILDDVAVSSTRTDPLLAPVRVVPEVDGVELLFMAAVGAASLSLRVLLDAVARATSRRGQEPPNLSRLAFVGLGFTLAAARSAGRVATGTLRVAEQATSFSLDAVPSLLRGPVDDRVAAIRARDRERQLALTSAEVLAEHLATALVPRVAAAFLDQLDLTAIVEERVDVDRIVRSVDLDAVVERIDLNAVVERIDLDAVADRIDVDAVAARLDVEALVERLDLPGLARTVIDEIDLPEVIRRSTGVVASETVRGVRMQGIDADRAVASFVDRVLGRRQPRFPRDAAPSEVDSADHAERS
jgi:hypothetical protein